MSVNLLAEVRKTIDPDVNRCLAEIIDEHPAKTQDAVIGTVPALVAAMLRSSKTPDGAENVFRAVGEFNGGMISNFRMIIESGEYQDLADAGNRLARCVIGAETDRIISALATHAFITQESAAMLLKLLTPLVLAIAGEERRVRGLNRNNVTSLLKAQQSFFAFELSADSLERLGLENASDESRPAGDATLSMFVPQSGADDAFVPPLTAAEDVEPSSATIVYEDLTVQREIDARSEDGKEEPVADALPTEMPITESNSDEPSANESYANDSSAGEANANEAADVEPVNDDGVSSEVLDETTTDELVDESTPGETVPEELEFVPNRFDDEYDEYRFSNEEAKIAPMDLISKAILPVLAVSAVWFYAFTMFGKQSVESIPPVTPVSHVNIDLSDVDKILNEGDARISEDDSHLAIVPVTVLDDQDSFNRPIQSAFSAEAESQTEDENLAAQTETATSELLVAESPNSADPFGHEEPTLGEAADMQVAENESPVVSSSIAEVRPIDSETSKSARVPKNYFLVGTIKVPVFDAPRKVGRSYYSESSRQ